jgi:N-acetylglucosamine-6-phosphate deacetylase
MGSFAIHAKKFVLPGRVAGPGYLCIADGKFSFFSSAKPEGEIIEAPGTWVAPGFVDTHIHGFFGHATTDADFSGINAASVELARHGTTSWLPTTFTLAADEIGRDCAAIAKATEDQGPTWQGARVQGIFLEGPFFTMAHVGAQNPQYLCDPDYELYRSWQDSADGLIRRSALAPERTGSVSYISKIVNDGIVAAIAHTDATYEQTLAAVDAGATSFVHTYNGMRGFTHREPGVVGAALSTASTYAEVICDGHHVSPAAVGALIAAKGWQHVVLITDCLGCGGLPDGEYTSGGLPVVMRGGACYLRDQDRLAGSVLTLALAVRNVVDWDLVTAEQAIRMATEIPARANHIDGYCGKILPGRDADLVILRDDLSVAATYVGGTAVGHTKD